MKKSNYKRINVLIANATSPKNPGDQAMLEVLISLVKTVHPTAAITIHAADPHLYPKNGYTVKHTLYSWSAFEKRSTLSRCLRVLKLLAQYALLGAGIHHAGTDRALSALIADYRNADLILFVGGGYLRSRKGIKQSLNVLMQVFLFKFAALFPAKKIVGPVSIGPFGYSWQEQAVVRELRTTDILAIREHFSHTLVKKQALKNTVRSADHALMTRKEREEKKKRPNDRITVGFTVRPWLQGKKQSNLETSLLWALEQFARTTGAKIQPIVQVDAPEYGEDDAAVTTKITEQLLDRNIDVLPAKTVHTVADAVRVYADLDLLLGMRMHSNIFAATQGVPFVAISYEYKTEGIAKQLGMEKYCIPCETVNGARLHALLHDAYTNRNYLSKELTRIVKTINTTETKKWNKYLSL